MGERSIVIQYADAEVVEHRTELPDDRTFEQRINDTLAATLEHLPGEASEQKIAVRCDVCGGAQEISEPRLPEGWITDARGEVCPSCQEPPLWLLDHLAPEGWWQTAPALSGRERS